MKKSTKPSMKIRKIKYDPYVPVRGVHGWGREQRGVAARTPSHKHLPYTLPPTAKFLPGNQNCKVLCLSLIAWEWDYYRLAKELSNNTKLVNFPLLYERTYHTHVQLYIRLHNYLCYYLLLIVNRTSYGLILTLPKYA